jgi:phosphohistidine swiveling domain-containing protein
MKDFELVEYIRGGATFVQCAEPSRAFVTGVKKYFSRGINYLVIYFSGDTLYWYYEKKDLYKEGKIVANKLLSSKSFENRFFKVLDKKTKEILDFIKKNNSAEIRIINNSSVAKVYEKYSKMLFDWYSLTMTIDGTDEFLMVEVTERIKKPLKDKLNKAYSEKEFLRVYNILTISGYLSYLNDEKRLILELMEDVDEKKITEKSDKFNKRIGEIVKRFWWAELGWKKSKGRDDKDIIKIYDGFRKIKLDPNTELKKMDEYVEKTSYQKNQINKEYPFLKKDKKLLKFLELSNKLVKYHDIRKEVQMKGNYWSYQVFSEISKKINIEEELLGWCEASEVSDILNGKKFDRNELKNRSSNFIYIYQNGKGLKLSGGDAKKKYEEIMGSMDQTTGDLQGLGASPGKVTGHAFVARTSQDALKIEAGQILVTGMTTPDFVPAMNKAVAIVTDEGGITCHAAIICRELKIPCIVGAKYATRIIKTGDTIEVLANHGVVKILKKKQIDTTSVN